MEKRGISPLIATVLLVGITIAVATIVFIFVQDVVQQQTDETGSQADLSFACLRDVKLDIISLCKDSIYPGFNEVFKIIVRNRASADIADLKINVFNGMSSQLFEDYYSLGPYVSDSFFLVLDSFQVDEITDIHLIPTIILSDVLGTCPTISFEVNELGECEICGDGFCDSAFEDDSNCESPTGDCVTDV